jgi:peptide/nickel transport system substrate-binding protein
VRPLTCAFLATLALVLSGCGSGSDGASGPRSDQEFADAAAELSGPATFGSPSPGGTFRLASPDLGLSANLDPSAEYTADGWGILQSLLVRSLLGYRFTAGEAGDVLRPDLAESLPSVSDDGLTYTVRLRRGVRFGPPVDREVTAADVAYAFRRIATPSVAAQYAFYYEVIEGFREYEDGAVKRIAGIATPDDHTIVFRLTRPTPDFAYRLALPATAPIPEEVAGCHAGVSEYGRYLIASGPYMIAGSEDLDIADCSRQRPLSGFDPPGTLELVRNPSYSPETDDPTVREALPDRFSFQTNTNVADIFRRIERGQLDATTAGPPPAAIQRYFTDTDLRPRLRVNPTAAIGFLSMNLTEPPFDDVNVRRALNYALDLQGMRRALGGPLVGPIATHVLPDAILDLSATPDGGVFYQKPPFGGDIPSARKEMTLSRYDTDGDGRCDGPACRGVVTVTEDASPASAMTPILQQSAAEIGLDLQVRALPFGSGIAAVGSPSKRIALNNIMSWGKDYDDPAGFIDPLFTSGGIQPSGSTNTSLVGLTAKQAGELHVRLPAGGVPSVDADAARCAEAAGEERISCYTALDRRIMTDIVPWVPHLQNAKRSIIGPAVTKFDFDESSSGIAWSHVAVDPALQAR